MNNKNIVNLAKSYLGKVKYVFGADDVPNGKADCSSFVQYIYKENGVNIGRTTGAQWTSGGTKIKNKSDLKEGDLVFFQGTYASAYVDNCSHVGIYIGNNKFIHCSSGANNVVEGDLTTDYWTKHWLGGLRKSEVDYNGVATNDFSNTSSESVDFDFVGNIVKYVVVVGLIITGIVSLIFSLGIHKQIIKSMI